MRTIDELLAQCQSEPETRAILCLINGLSEDTQEPEFAIDKKMLQRFAQCKWIEDKRDNLHQTDTDEWIVSAFYERVILYLSLSQYIKLDPIHLLAASATLAQYLQTLSKEEQIAILNYLLAKPTLTQGIIKACQNSILLNSVLGLAILEHQDDILQKDIAESLLTSIYSHLATHDPYHRKKVLFVIRAIYQYKIKIKKLVKLITTIPGFETLPSTLPELLKILFKAIGYTQAEMAAALLCFGKNYQRILLGSVINGRPDLKAALNYFFLGNKINDQLRAHVLGENGLVFVISSEDMITAYNRGDFETAEVLLLMGALTAMPDSKRFDVIKSMTIDEQLSYVINHGLYQKVPLLIAQGAKASHIFLNTILSSVSLTLIDKEAFDWSFLRDLITAGAESLEDKRSALLTAVSRGFENAVHILLSADCQIKAMSKEPNLLIRAITSGNSERGKIKILNMLIHAGFDINAYGTYYVGHEVTPLRMAIYIKQEFVIRFLLEKSADINLLPKLDGKDMSDLSEWKVDEKFKRLMTLCFQINGIIKTYTNDSKQCVIKVLTQFIKYYSPEFSFILSPAHLSAIIKKTMDLRSRIERGEESSTESEGYIKVLHKILQEFVAVELSQNPTDEEEKDLVTVCNRLIYHFDVQLLTFDKNIVDKPGSHLKSMIVEMKTL